MNYSTALLESIEAAQILAGHYQGHTLDTWHLLTLWPIIPIAWQVLY